MIPLKKKLKETNQPAIGSWITIPNRTIAEIMKNAGFEWLCIDLEHTVTTIKEAGDLIAIIDSPECSPLVRLSDNDPVQIKRVMDAGAHGIIVPMIMNANDVKRAHSAMHYPNLGTRGVGLARAQKYGANFEGYKTWLKESAILIGQIEHIDAINNLEEILALQELDAYIVGPYDLSASMGIPGEFDNPKFLQAMEKINEAIKNNPKPGGYHIVEPSISQLKEKVSTGCRFIAYSVDIRMIDVSSREGLKSLQ